MNYEYKAHPWHGISAGENVPQEVTAFIEIVPRDTVKYEIEKKSGFLQIDRPQKFSNVYPANYGFIPQSYCGERIANLAREYTQSSVKGGDGDPLDILVLTEHNIPRGDILLKARPIGGFCLIDHGEADDKIIATLEGDLVYSQYEDISQLPKGILKRFEHYFLTYKNLPNETAQCTIAYSYGRGRAHEIILNAMDDYKEYRSSHA
ncbi:MAG: inorganic pyrophosphatase [Pyrinomonadaceae bacterium]